MRLRTNLSTWTAGLFLTLGLSSTACGSTAEDGRSFPCNNPAPAVPGQETGYESCEGGWTHRTQAVQCQSLIPRAGYVCSAGAGSGTCSTDADCAATPNSYCDQGVQTPCQCMTGCLTDADCGAGSICVCGSPIGHCAPASCTTDADCGSTKLCSSYQAEPYCGPTTFACQTSKDQCAGSADCAPGEACTVVGDRRVCSSPTCVIGRPFLVAGRERLAEPARRADWSTPLAIACAEVAPSLRETLAQRWTEMGLMEHASVAAFARFALQLLALGAPPELVLDTQRALGDETEHARICFAVASSYADRPIGPGALSLEGALDGAADLESVLRLTVREGCVGETVAAIEAAEAAEHAQDATLRDALRRIAADERRHSELAWRFARWALETSGGRLDHVLAEELRLAELTTEAPPDSSPDDQHLLRHGVVPEPLRAEIRRRALREVVAPCARALRSVPERAAA